MSQKKKKQLLRDLAGYGEAGLGSYAKILLVCKIKEMS